MPDALLSSTDDEMKDKKCSETQFSCPHSCQCGNLCYQVGIFLSYHSNYVQMPEEALNQSELKFQVYILIFITGWYLFFF